MIKVEIELAKCHERTKDPAIVRLMMQAKADVLMELREHEDIRHRCFELGLWVQQQQVHMDRERELAPA